MQEKRDWVVSQRPAATLSVVLTRPPVLREIEVGEWCKPGVFYHCGWEQYGLHLIRGQNLCRYYYESLEFEDDGLGDEERKDSHDLTSNFKTLLTVLSIGRNPIEGLSARLHTSYEENGELAEDLRGAEVCARPFDSSKSCDWRWSTAKSTIQDEDQPWLAPIATRVCQSVLESKEVDALLHSAGPGHCCFRIT